MPNWTCNIQAMKPANMKNSPWAKLMTPVALLTTTKPKATRAYNAPVVMPLISR